MLIVHIAAALVEYVVVQPVFPPRRPVMAAPTDWPDQAVRIMTDGLSTIAGALLIFLICAWAVWFLTAQLWSGIASGTAVDRTLSECHKEDAPGMFLLQLVGFVLLIVASAGIGLGAIIVLIAQLASG